MISIIIATFNSSRTLAKALESVLTQNYSDWECIVVDGLSSDGTLDIIKNYELKDSRFKHISERDNGIYDAFNKGWHMAKGEWVYYLGSDDYVTKDGLRQLAAAATSSYGIISGHCYVEELDGTLKKVYSIGFSGCHQGKITRKSILEQFNGFNEKYPVMSDADLMIRMEKHGVKILNVDSFVAYFASDGTSHKLSGLWKRGLEYYRIYKANNFSFPRLRSWHYCFVLYRSFVYRYLRRLFLSRKK